MIFPPERIVWLREEDVGTFHRPGEDSRIVARSGSAAQDGGRVYPSRSREEQRRYSSRPACRQCYFTAGRAPALAGSARRQSASRPWLSSAFASLRAVISRVLSASDIRPVPWL